LPAPLPPSATAAALLPGTAPAAADPPLLDPSTDTALVWQGFQHGWTYNHRVNRLGDYLRGQTCGAGGACTATVGHTASSGVGPDTASYTSYRATVSAPGVRFLDGETSLVLRGEEGVTTTVTRQITVAAPPSMRGRGATVLLNGFDLVAIDAVDEPADADQIEDFDLHVGDAAFDPTTNSLRFPVSFSFRGACRTLECEWLDTRLDYRLAVRYLLVSGPPSAMDTLARTQLQRGPYSWVEDCLTVCPNPEITPASVNATGTTTFHVAAQPQFTRLLLGIQSVRLSTDIEHYLLNWNSHLGQVGFQPATGTVTAFNEQFFKQWRRHMADTYLAGLGAIDDAGTATLQLGLAPMAFLDSACVRTNQTVAGSFEPPPGNGEDPNTAQETPVSFSRESACAS
jgi:hypothetical protein